MCDNINVHVCTIYWDRSLVLNSKIIDPPKKNKINGMACLKALLFSGMLYLLNVEFSDYGEETNTTENAKFKSMFLSKKKGFSRGMCLDVN